MSAREPDGLIGRIRRMRRVYTTADEPASLSTAGPGQDEVRALEVRVAHLEQLVQGLQDSVHRESTRLTTRLGELDARTQPGALSKALSEDARDRRL
jgi:hypothetical protein